jgi:hypothetical protein
MSDSDINLLDELKYHTTGLNRVPSTAHLQLCDLADAEIRRLLRVNADLLECRNILCDLKGSGQFFCSSFEFDHDSNGYDFDKRINTVLKRLKGL